MSDAHATLLQSFLETQKRSGMSPTAFAKSIGISKQLWSAVVNNHKNIGEKFITAMLRAEPSLAPDILRYYMQRAQEVQP